MVVEFDLNRLYSDGLRNLGHDYVQHLISETDPITLDTGLDECEMGLIL